MERMQFVLFSFTCKIRAPPTTTTLSLLEFPTPRKRMEEAGTADAAQDSTAWGYSGAAPR